MQPWLSAKEISKIESYLTPTSIMLEWGSGGSTIRFAPQVLHYFSIEHDLEWYEKVRRVLPNNAEIFHVPNSLPRSFPNVKEEEFVDYINFVNQLDISFDFVLIDGRARFWCAEKVKEHLNPNATVFIHDWDRPHYHGVTEWYNIVEVVDKLVVLKPKKS